VPDALGLCHDPPALYYDQVAQIVMPRWTTGRVLLVGDACYAAPYSLDKAPRSPSPELNS
jgi:2-polyprenyl-6-methoxyphenol hydroxylase-like FAD-dependent oxidoreductase